jgi:hypothetical protein
MASLMNIALSAGGLLSKYLNQIFVITREVIQDGKVISHANYSQLGDLLWIVIGVGFIVPILTIYKFNPDPTKDIDEK